MSRIVSFTAMATLSVTLLGCTSKTATTEPEALYQENCARCHARAGEPGGPSLGGSKGPDISHVGSGKGMTVEWLASYIRDPRSVRPDARMMPAFEDKLTEEQIHSLAEYLAKKK